MNKESIILLINTNNKLVCFPTLKTNNCKILACCQSIVKDNYKGKDNNSKGLLV